MGRGKGEEEGLSLKNEITFLLLSMPHSWMGGLKSQILLHGCSHPQHLHAVRTHQLHTHAPHTHSHLLALSVLCLTVLFFLFGSASWHVGSWFLNHGSNLCPRQRTCGV